MLPDVALRRASKFRTQCANVSNVIECMYFMYASYLLHCASSSNMLSGMSNSTLHLTCAGDWWSAWSSFANEAIVNTENPGRLGSNQQETVSPTERILFNRNYGMLESNGNPEMHQFFWRPEGYLGADSLFSSPVSQGSMSTKKRGP